MKRVIGVDVVESMRLSNSAIKSGASSLPGNLSSQDFIILCFGIACGGAGWGGARIEGVS